ncbi:MAG: indole-3-glycerol phosphate synthase TrpC [Candidatus Omnitrophica bacterium]|nr:indole-3-glycerol phosphate synthase TrpC [Candidatus Omnitrophota bacterium]
MKALAETMVLNEILTQKRKDLEELKRRFPLHRLRQTAEKSSRSPVRSFKKAISGTRGINLVCEIKKASPSEGILREDFQPLRIAGYYEHAGAKAISILTETHYFKGRPSYLKTVRQVTSLPILRKDFILESFQIYESVLLEADAYLLIASILTEEELSSLIKLGRRFELDALVEVHTVEDLKKAESAGAELIGINNRNLQTLEVDVKNAQSIIPHVPKGIPIVVESGLKTYTDLMSYKSLGVHSFLVGTHLMRSPDIVGAVEELLGKRHSS